VQASGAAWGQSGNGQAPKTRLRARQRRGKRGRSDWYCDRARPPQV